MLKPRREIVYYDKRRRIAVELASQRLADCLHLKSSKRRSEGVCCAENGKDKGLRRWRELWIYYWQTTFGNLKARSPSRGNSEARAEGKENPRSGWS